LCREAKRLLPYPIGSDRLYAELVFEYSIDTLSREEQRPKSGGSADAFLKATIRSDNDPSARVVWTVRQQSFGPRIFAYPHLSPIRGEEVKVGWRTIRER
jgi:hypothetical protein